MSIEKPIIGITTGDINGIGIEVIIKTFSDQRMLELCTPVIFASNKVINYYRKVISDHPFSFHSTKDFGKLNPRQVNIFNCWEEEIPIHPGTLSEQGGKYALRSLEVAVQCLKDHQIEALVTAPIHKGNTFSESFPYAGHTAYLQEKLGAREVVMILYNQRLKVALATEHIPVSAITETLNQNLLTNKLHTLIHSLVKDFGIDRPKIAVLGLNPHAGDQGAIGTEEQTLIAPVIEKMQEQGHIIYGPYAPDGFFARSYFRHFDALLAMYHDQGLIPFKTLAQGDGVNFTAGLPHIRTSPDHGTAFDISGKNEADPSSFREAVFQAIDLLRHRTDYEEMTANPLRRGKIEKEKDHST